MFYDYILVMWCVCFFFAEPFYRRPSLDDMGRWKSMERPQRLSMNQQTQQVVNFKAQNTMNQKAQQIVN